MRINIVNQPVRARAFAFVILFAAGFVSTPASAADGGTCVGDIRQVVMRTATPTMMKATLPKDRTARVDAAAQASFAKAFTPGAVVGVRTPEGTWTAAYGMADPRDGRPMTVATHTRIGSVTKTFTGTVIMRLSQDHKLSLDDPIEKYVSGVPNGNSITLRQLANMTSGIASYTRSAKFTDTYFAKPETVFTPDELLKVGSPHLHCFRPAPGSTIPTPTPSCSAW